MDALLSLWNLFIVICFGNLLICSVASERLLNIADFLNGTFSYKRFNGSWISDTEILYQSDINKDIIKLDVETQKITVFLNVSTLLKYNISHFQLNNISISSDKQWMAVQIVKYKANRHSSLAKYVIHEFKTGDNYLLARGKYIQLLQWSPVGDALVYVMDNNIYYQHKHKQDPYAKDGIIYTGVTGSIYNGITDLVYDEEEVFSDSKALWFSPKGTKLAFITFDDSAVDQVNIPKYGKIGYNESEYENKMTMRYPKAGSTNPTVSLNVAVDLLHDETKVIKLPEPIEDVTEDNIIGMVKWVDGSYVAATWSPRVQNASIMLVCNALKAKCLKSGEFVMKFGDNNRLKELMSDLLMPEIKDLNVTIGDNFTALVRLLLPNKNATDKNSTEKYPLLLSVYGGPDSKKIDDHFLEPSWDVYLVTRMNIIIAYVDGRGSKNRGDNLKFAVYRKLGGPEVDDFISVAEYLGKNYHYIDRSRIAIWGSSYGGYATAMTLAKDNRNVFKCGISVAPITSWIYYDSIYTERYMGLPTSEDNMVGYYESDVLLKVENFRNKTFYLIHGNAAYNANDEQSIMLSKALKEKDILFDEQSYPEEDHGLGHGRLDLYHSMERFWSKCLNVIAEIEFK